MKGTDAVSEAKSSHGLVLGNAFRLVVAQALAVPLAVATNALMARYVGAADFGHYYLASTFVGLGFVVVAWGQSGTLPARVAQDRSRAGEWLGSGLAWRALAAPVVTGLLALGCYAFGYPPGFLTTLGLVALGAAIATLTGACLDAIRGFERTDVAAYCQVATPFLTVSLMLPVLVLGGGFVGALLVFVAANALVLVFATRFLGRVGIGVVSASWRTGRVLLVEGWPFLVFGLSLAVQQNIDAVFLSKLAPAEVVGWYAASQKIIGALVYPAGAFVAALYPTLCRLNTQDPEAFLGTARRGIETTGLIVMPIALGCVLYADVFIQLFSQSAFGPAADNLRLLAPFILLVYLSMPIGALLLAAGRQRAWTLIQLTTVGISVVLNPLLVPWFQARTANGGLGIVVATLVSESVMVAGGLWAMPRGVLTRSLGHSLFRCAFAAVCMASVALLLRGVLPHASGPLALLVYGGALWAVGGIDRERIEDLKELLARKFRVGGGSG